MKRTHLSTIASAALILVFSYAAFSKMLDMALFKAQLDTHPLLRHFPALLAIALPVGELGISVLLTIPKTRKTGFCLSAGLLLLFIIYLSIMLTTSSHLPCSCGGIINGLGWKGHILLNTALLMLSLAGLL